MTLKLTMKCLIAVVFNVFIFQCKVELTLTASLMAIGIYMKMTKISQIKAVFAEELQKWQ